MLHNYNVTFPSGSIITGQQLQLLHDQPQKFLKFQYMDNSDGVISGMELVEAEGILSITPGMYKYNGAFYLLEEKFNVELENQAFESGLNYSVILSASENVEAPNIIDDQLQVLVVKSNSISDTSVSSICTFYGNPQLPKYCKRSKFSEKISLQYLGNCGLP